MTVKPAFTRQAAIGQPMLPTPMNPTLWLMDQAPFFESISLNTSVAILNASSAAGMPQ